MIIWGLWLYLVVDAAFDVDGAARVDLLVPGLRQPRLDGARCNRRKRRRLVSHHSRSRQRRQAS